MSRQSADGPNLGARVDAAGAQTESNASKERRQRGVKRSQTAHGTERYEYLFLGASVLATLVLAGILFYAISQDVQWAAWPIVAAIMGCTLAQIVPAARRVHVRAAKSDEGFELGVVVERVDRLMGQITNEARVGMPQWAKGLEYLGQFAEVSQETVGEASKLLEIADDRVATEGSEQPRLLAQRTREIQQALATLGKTAENTRGYIVQVGEQVRRSSSRVIDEKAASSPASRRQEAVLRNLSEFELVLSVSHQINDMIASLPTFLLQGRNHNGRPTQGVNDNG